MAELSNHRFILSETRHDLSNDISERRRNGQTISRKRFLQSIAAAGALGAAGLALGESVIATVSAGSSLGIDPATFIADIESGTFKAYNGSTGSVVSSGTDAASVLNYALSQLSSGGTLFIREGTYPLSTGLTVGHSNSVIRMSKGALLTLNGLTSDVITVNASDVTLDSVNIDGTLGSTSTGALIRVGNTSNSQRCMIFNCNLPNPTYHGIRLDTFSGVCFVYCNRIQTNTSTGVGILIQGSDHHIFQNDVGGFGQLPIPSPMDAAITCSGSGEIDIIGNQLYNNGVGIDVYDSNFLRILGNNIWYANQQGIRLYCDPGSTYPQFIIQGNNISSNGAAPTNPNYSAGIHLTGTGNINNVIIEGNLCNDPNQTKTQNYGIRLDDPNIHNLLVSNNIVTDNKIQGIYSAVSGTGILITNNVGG